MVCFSLIILRFLFYANTAFSLLSPLVSTCLFSESRVHVSGEEWALSWDAGFLLFHALTRTVDRKNKWTKTKELSSSAMERRVKRSPGLLSVCILLWTGDILVTMGSIFPLLKHHWLWNEVPPWVKIIIKQISSVAAISSLSLISCFFYFVPHKQC